MALVTEVCFVLGNEEFQVQGGKLAKSSRYFEELFENSEDFNEVRLILPEWIKLRPFKVYLNYVETGRLPKLDLVITQKLLWLGDFFKDDFLQTTLINSHILPFLNKETVLLFVQDTCTKISTGLSVPRCWFELFSQTCQFAADNLNYLLTETYSVFSKLDPIAIKEIFERSACSPSFPDYLRKLQSLKSSPSLLSLLALLETESLGQFQQLSSTLQVFNWEINDFEFGNFYKESEPFKIGSTDWVLCIWCFEHEKRLEISLKLAEVTKALKQKLSVLTLTVLVQDERLSDVPVKVHPIPAYSPSSPIIREINEFQLDSVQKFSIRLYASPQEVISAILAEVIRSPEVLDLDKEAFLSRNFVLSVLSSKYLNVGHEDQALEILANWVEGSAEEDEELLARLNESIFWDFVSMKELVHVSFNHQRMKKIQVFASSIKKELESKGKKLGSKDYVEEASGGRKSYKGRAGREQFLNQKEFVTTLCDLMISTCSEEKVGLRQESKMELKAKLQQAELEIEVLKSVRNDVISPIPQLKLPEEENSIAFTPVNRTVQGKSRSSSNDNFLLKSFEALSRSRCKNAGAVIGDLVHKLKSARKYR